jgi:hypothetical protein
VIRALNCASEALKAANTRAAQLEGIVARTAPIEAQLSEVRRAHNEAVGKWIADGCIGDRPVPSVEMVDLERRLGELSIDAAVNFEAARVKSERDEVRIEAQRVGEAVRALVVQRSEAVFVAAHEAARTHAEGFTAALNDALAFEATLRGLADELFRIGHSGREGSTVAMSVAGQIIELTTAAKRAAGVQPETASGQRLLRHLMTDARATL